MSRSPFSFLLGRQDIEVIAKSCGLTLKHYETFLFGLNQIAVLTVSPIKDSGL